MPVRLYRVGFDDRDNLVRGCSLDFRRVLKLRKVLIDRKPSVIHARFEEGRSRAITKRLGRLRPRCVNA